MVKVMVEGCCIIFLDGIGIIVFVYKLIVGWEV